VDELRMYKFLLGLDYSSVPTPGQGFAHLSCS
jgi:hypothetical protein